MRGVFRLAAVAVLMTMVAWRPALAADAEPVVKVSKTYTMEAAAAKPAEAPKPAETPKAPDPSTLPWTERPNICPPLVWGCDNEWKLQFGGSIMTRFEKRRNLDLTKAVDDDDDLTFLRTFVNLDLSYRKLTRIFVEFVDSQATGWRLDPLQNDRWDVFQAFVELKAREDSPWTLRLGRQVLPIVSEGRQWGRPPVEFYWFNLLPVFDGVMLDYKTKTAEVHTFLLKPLTSRHIDEDTGVVYSDTLYRVSDAWHYGIYSQFKNLAPHTYDLYVLGFSDHGDDRDFPPGSRDEDGTFDNEDRISVGTCWRGPIKKWEGCGTLGYGFEAAYQFGHIGDDRINAYMLHGDINYEWEHPWKPKVTLLANWASGDNRVGDNEINTFSPYYGASHYGYGTMDLFRLTNLREIALTGSISPTTSVRVLLEAHQYWLDSESDAWNTAIGTTFGRNVAGDWAREAGTEFDITLYYKPNKRWAFELGAAHFIPGEAARDRGRDDSANFVFLQTVFSF